MSWENGRTHTNIGAEVDIKFSIFKTSQKCILACRSQSTFPNDVGNVVGTIIQQPSDSAAAATILKAEVFAHRHKFRQTTSHTAISAIVIIISVMFTIPSRKRIFVSFSWLAAGGIHSTFGSECIWHTLQGLHPRVVFCGIRGSRYGWQLAALSSDNNNPGEKWHLVQRFLLGGSVAKIHQIYLNIR